MYRLLNKGGRAYIIKKESVLKGGELLQNKEDVAFNQGTTIEVTDACGTFLTTYKDVQVLEKVLDKKKKAKEL